MERFGESVEAARSAGKGEHRHGDGRVAVGTTVTVTVTPVDAYAGDRRCGCGWRIWGGVGLLFGESISIGSEVTIHLPCRREASGSNDSAGETHKLVAWSATAGRSPMGYFAWGCSSRGLRSSGALLRFGGRGLSRLPIDR